MSSFVYQLGLHILDAQACALLFRTVTTKADVIDAIEAEIMRIEPRVVAIDSAMKRDDFMHEERAALRQHQSRLVEYVELVKAANSLPIAEELSGPVHVTVAGVKIGTIDLNKFEIIENAR